jgi:hypothetical protein
MATVGDGRDDLSIRLEWPVDTLNTPPPAPAPTPEREDPLAPVAARIEALAGKADARTAEPEDVVGAIRDLRSRLDAVTSEIVEALRSMYEALLRSLDENTTVLDERIAGLRTAMMGMLASRQAEDQRTLHREREALVAHVEEEMKMIAGKLTEAASVGRAQSDVFADRVAAELQSLRRRIPLKGRDASTIDDDTIDDLVSRVADEVEIRIAAALKPRPKPKPKPRRKA